ncbi:MFS general substrate transporter [Setomelanomma holmii]|uniref:MFS general substrate transporter n=1 Tax=Setomelanomma holmii TaxID=210430 RepID=A0A9P4HLC5_9PLEO|nr:MFS general substrate transporter [Setomelanomma holmii]
MTRASSTGIAYHGFKDSDSDVKLTLKSTTPQSSAENEAIDTNQPAGVIQMQAILQVWTKKWLIAAYALMLVVSLTNSLQQQANYSWVPYATSSFGKHGLTAITSLVANVVGGVSRLPLARLMDVWGRPHVFMVCMTLVVLSLTLMALCQNVETYLVSQVFYWTGMNGMAFVLEIFVQDTAQFVHRLVYLAIMETPYICNTFAGPELGQRFLDSSTWHWGYGAFAIITPFVCIPFCAIFFLLSRKAKRMGVVPKEKVKSGRTFMQTLVHGVIEMDIVGLLLLCCGFSLLLLPFGLSAYQKDGWASPRMIFMIVFGFLLLVTVILWERLWAPKPFFPFFLMKDRSVVAACFLGCNTWIAFYCFKMYYTSYLQVVFSLSVAKAGYITNIYNIVSCTWAVLIALVYIKLDSYKWSAVIAMPIQLLMTGLLIHFRKPNTHIGLLVMVEVFWAMCGAVMVQVEQIAIMSAVPHENLPTALAVMYLVTQVGGAVGQAISGSLWTHIVPNKLAEYLPADKKSEAARIYASLPVQLSYAWGTPERQAIVRAYGDAQKVMVVVGTCALVPCFLWVALLKNNRLSAHPERKGLQA